MVAKPVLNLDEVRLEPPPQFFQPRGWRGSASCVSAMRIIRRAPATSSLARRWFRFIGREGEGADY